MKSQRPYVLLLIMFAPIDVGAVVESSQAPIRVWCDSGNVAGIYESGQEVCDARAATIPGSGPWTYQADPAAPADGPGGNCYNNKTGGRGLAHPGLVWACPINYQPRAPFGWSNYCWFVDSSTGYVGNYTGTGIVCDRSGPDPNKNKGPQHCPRTQNPINVGVQNKVQEETDIGGTNDSTSNFTRIYNSARVMEVGNPNVVPVPRVLSSHWSSTYDARISLAVSGSYQTASVLRPDGRVLFFNLNGTQWIPDLDVSDRLVRLVDVVGNPNGWRYTVASNDDVEDFDISGRIVAIASRTGALRSLAYDGQGHLASVSDNFGRSLHFTYGTNGRVRYLTDPAGQVIEFQYDSLVRLTRVIFPGGGSRQYHYENATYKHALTGITDENGVRYSTYAYDTSGKAISAELAGGVARWQVAPESVQMRVTDPNGGRCYWTFSTVQGVVKPASATQPCAPCGTSSSAVTYDANGNVSSDTDFNNKKVCSVYDLGRNLETARAEGILSSETCGTVLATLPSRADVRKISTQWHAIWRLPTKIAEPNRITTNTYNGDGGVYCAPTTALVAGNPIGVRCTKTVRETTDTTGQQGFAATLTGTPRIWQYTYDSYGQVLTATDPNSKTTTTAYYAANDPDPGKRGNVQKITNPLGHVITIMAYDLNGRPLSITDPNGVVTTLTYHPRGWLTSRTVGGETTGYDYDGVGQLTQVTRPDGSYVAYTYDGAHRLTQLQDGLGNKIVYTLDAMGNRLKEQAFEADGTLARTRQQVYDSLNRLHQSVGAQ